MPIWLYHELEQKWGGELHLFPSKATIHGTDGNSIPCAGAAILELTLEPDCHLGREVFAVAEVPRHIGPILGISSFMRHYMSMSGSGLTCVDEGRATHSVHTKWKHTWDHRPPPSFTCLDENNVPHYVDVEWNYPEETPNFF